jgi:hypothetical protein
MFFLKEKCFLSKMINFRRSKIRFKRERERERERERDEKEF